MGHFIIAQQRFVGDADTPIETGMAVEYPRPRWAGHWTSKPSRVRQLQTDQQIISAPKSLPMRLHQQAAQVGQVGEGMLGEEELVGVGPTIGTDRDRLAAPDQLRPAGPE